MELRRQQSTRTHQIHFLVRRRHAGVPSKGIHGRVAQRYACHSKARSPNDGLCFRLARPVFKDLLDCFDLGVRRRNAVSEVGKLTRTGAVPVYKKGQSPELILTQHAVAIRIQFASKVGRQVKTFACAAIDNKEEIGCRKLHVV